MLTILPAGGRAERFDGIYKELLPIGEGDFLLSAAIRRASHLGADRALVISNADKLSTHTKFLARHAAPYSVDLQMRDERDEDLWAAMWRVMPRTDAGFLVLPDTTWRCTGRIPEDAHLAFGIFSTDEPYRFSLVHEGRILTKPNGLTGTWQAWGCVYWSAEVAAYWDREQKLRGMYPHYDRAFEAAMQEFGYGTFGLDDYHDLGTWNAYSAYVRAA